MLFIGIGYGYGSPTQRFKKSGGIFTRFGILALILHGILVIWLGLMVGQVYLGQRFWQLWSQVDPIAAPAAVRIALPKANPSYYLTASLGITFPFNITIGIPIYYLIATWMGA